MINKAKKILLDSWCDQDFDHASFYVFNLRTFESDGFETHKGEQREIPHFYYDLASITKPLTMGALFSKSPELFDTKLKLLLEHRGGLPRWAILGRKSWQATVGQYEISKSGTDYSDLSMLRLMLEIEEKTGEKLKNLSSFYWDKELLFWKDLPKNSICADTGFRKRAIINGQVNDDNCFKINQFCPHAGLFATSQGLLKSLFNLEKKVSLLKQIESGFSQRNHDRFLNGWDTVSDSSNTLAGIGAPKMTFGHLGFTGTSVWIDAESGKGWFLLTNATKKYWYNRKHLSLVRKDLGQVVWSSLH